MDNYCCKIYKLLLLELWIFEVELQLSFINRFVGCLSVFYTIYVRRICYWKANKNE